MFEPLPSKFSFPEAEKRVLEFWEQHDVFGKSLEQRADSPRFVFYEGPPTANGLPHPGHCLTRAMKDLFPRYQTMCGKLVERKAGWDTHGLPVEVEVCKELGIHTKEEIESYGVAGFVQRCIESVFRYTREWEEMTRRLGFWVNLEDAYVTYHQSYVESVWWSLKTLFERGLLYQGHKVVWWWAQGGTALSAGEVGEGYRTVDDPSVYIRFPLVDPPAENVASGVSPDVGSKKASLLIWTTTPWTLISNHFAAVGPDIDYALVHDKTTDDYLYIAAALVETISHKVKHEFEVVSTCKGTDLVGLHYIPPFDCYHRTMGKQTAPLKAGGEASIGWRVLSADFVTLESGTGLVHEAPAFGEVDFDLLQQERQNFADPDAVPVICAVAPNGTLNEEAPEPYRGRWVKDCDKDIIRELKDRGILLHQEQIRHEYPFCPRAENDPLIQYARKSWFVRTSRFKDEFLKNNAAIKWLPDHIQEGRFGDFLRNNVDWALSRERYWGTPLPIWVCQSCGKLDAIGSFNELQSKPGATDEGFWERMKSEHPEMPDDLRVHKPYVDEWTYTSTHPHARPADEQKPEECTGTMKRVTEVIDCWWDAGSMPFAQWGFPYADGSVEKFVQHFPADFISEAIDQTRGWFYGLLAIASSLVREPVHRFLNSKPGPGRMAFIRSDSDQPTAHEQRMNKAKTELEKQLGLQDAMTADQLNRLIDAAKGPLPYRTCVVLGHMMGEDGLKMSKRVKNYKEPAFIFDQYGADAMRWYFFSAQTPWTSVRFLESNIRDAQREFLVRLYNVFSFFNIYANIDGFTVAPVSNRWQGTGYKPVPQRSELDRWISSELHRTTKAVRERLDGFENYPAAGRLNEFVDALSNWYVRRSRERFWRSERDQDKWDAYNTLYEALLTLSKLIAPFTPFFAETMYRNLTRSDEATKGRSDEGVGDVASGASPDVDNQPISVHLCDYPTPDESLIDERLGEEMDLVRQIVSLGRAARTSAKLKVRQPLAQVEIILARREHTEWLDAHRDLIAEELNIKSVEFPTAADHYVTYQIKPEFKAIGPKFGKLAPKVADALQKIDPTEAKKSLESTGELFVEVDGQRLLLTHDEARIRLEAKPGWSAAQGRAGVVVVKTELSVELNEEGLIR